jgi:hypothetical protein
MLVSILAMRVLSYCASFVFPCERLQLDNRSLAIADLAAISSASSSEGAAIAQYNVDASSSRPRAS